jgi:putative iron-dependent peroxidase
MPFGAVARGDFGTYFIGYARSPRPIEQMLTNMFTGRPPGNYDRLLDFSTAVTGTLFFVPSVPLLESLADAPAETVPATGEVGPGEPDAGDLAPAAQPTADGSLGLGNLRGVAQHE